MKILFMVAVQVQANEGYLYDIVRVAERRKEAHQPLPEQLQQILSAKIFPETAINQALLKLEIGPDWISNISDGFARLRTSKEEES